MGIEIADQASREGAHVELVLGPSDLNPAEKNVKVTRVVTAAEMEEVCTSRFTGCDIAILAAAVADYSPEQTAVSKIKSKDKGLVIRLKPTTDIAMKLGRLKSVNQVLVGFALETDNEEKNAFEKLKRKNLDLIVLNSLNDEGAGFGHKTNRISIIDKNNNIDKFELKLKSEAAADIIQRIAQLIRNR